MGVATRSDALKAMIKDYPGGAFPAETASRSRRIECRPQGVAKPPPPSHLSTAI